MIATEYAFPAEIYSSETPDSQRFPAFLNVLLFGEKIGKTPEAFNEPTVPPVSDQGAG